MHWSARPGHLTLLIQTCIIIITPGNYSTWNKTDPQPWSLTTIIWNKHSYLTTNFDVLQDDSKNNTMWLVSRGSGQVRIWGWVSMSLPVSVGRLHRGGAGPIFYRQPIRLKCIFYRQPIRVKCIYQTNLNILDMRLCILNKSCHKIYCVICDISRLLSRHFMTWCMHGDRFWCFSRSKLNGPSMTI